jgi:hypothetical protein
MVERPLDSLSDCTNDHWRALGVLACEPRLGPSAIEKLGLPIDVRAWLRTLLEQGIISDAGVVYGASAVRGLAGERAISLVPEIRAFVLRKLGTLGLLDGLVQDGAKVTGETSHARWCAALYSGKREVFENELTTVLRRQQNDEESVWIRSLFFDTILRSFDAEWLLSTWGDFCHIFATQSLLDAVVALQPVDELYRWMASRIGKFDDPRSARILLEHALLRGDLDVARSLIVHLPIEEQLPVQAATAFIAGESELSQQLIDESASARMSASTKGTRACAHSVTALLCCLALSRGPKDGTTLARRIFQRYSGEYGPLIPSWPLRTAQADVGRAIRTLTRRISQPTSERMRLSPHHRAADSSAWETFLLGLVVLLQESDGVTRMAWANRFQSDGKRLDASGYVWFARQMLQLAAALAIDNAGNELALKPRPGEVFLVHLFEREPEWRRALRLIDEFAAAEEQNQSTLAHRVAWFLDMNTGELAKPMLEEYRDGVGWTRRARVELAELRERVDRLPPEDVAVIRAYDATPPRGRPQVDAVEALCGHPRVSNGSRGRLPVEVVRGNGRVETRSERGMLVITVEPEDASEGVKVVVESETRVTVYRISANLARLMASLAGSVRVPDVHRDEALLALSRLAEHVEIRSPELGATRTVAADTTPCLRITPEVGAFWVEVGIRPFGEHGRFFPPGLGQGVVTVHGGGELIDAERNLRAEESRFAALLATCPTLRAATSAPADSDGSSHEPVFGFSLGEEELFSLLTELRDCGLSCQLEWKGGKAIRARGSIHGGSLTGALRRIKGWYIVDGRVQLDEVTSFELSELVRMPYTRTGRFLRLPSGDFVEVERRVRMALASLARLATLPTRGASGPVKLPEVAFESVDALLEVATALDVESSATELRERLSGTLASSPQVPTELRATLRPYQIEGYQWLHRNGQLGFGVCLADDMGLGKTLQVIALLISRSEGGPALVVAPTSVCGNWASELARFAPKLMAVEYVGRTRASLLEPLTSGSKGESLVLITSYALLQQDATELSSIEWNTTVLDEAQFIKNPHSLRAKAAFRLSSRYRIAMTGTPVENHLGDLWSVFHYANPSLLGSLKHFQLTYLKPIEREGESESVVELKRLIRPFLLRRRKAEVLSDLPPLTVMSHLVRMSDDESRRYALLRHQVHEKLHTSYGKRERKLEVLAEITRLRRFCCHPRLVFPDAPLEATKLQAFLELADELRENGHRALVFSQYVDFLQLVRERLDEMGFRYSYLDGATKAAERRARVEAFQTGNNELFLISLKAGGFGLNLTSADYVIHLDPWWNPAVEAQATDRAHRIGQERPITVYRMIAKDSIEERIVQLHLEKRKIADVLLTDTDAPTMLEIDDLMDLLGGIDEPRQTKGALQLQT